MDIKDIAEQSYKNGYAQGVKETAEALKIIFPIYEQFTRYGNKKINEAIDVVVNELTERE